MKFYELTVDTIFLKGNFKGKMTRSDFWLYYLFAFLWVIIIALILAPLSLIVGAGVFAGLVPVLLLLAVSRFGAHARRLHDVGKSGWWQFVPIYSLYLYLKPSSEIGSISTPANYESN
jgi:uncharacterized membrane protein YhaH (DUF805 family)